MINPDAHSVGGLDDLDIWSLRGPPGLADQERCLEHRAPWPRSHGRIAQFAESPPMIKPCGQSPAVSWCSPCGG